MKLATRPCCPEDYAPPSSLALSAMRGRMRVIVTIEDAGGVAGKILRAMGLSDAARPRPPPQGEFDFIQCGN